jgi:hypothetical protein
MLDRGAREEDVPRRQAVRGPKLVGIKVLAASRLFKNPEAPEVELQYLVPMVPMVTAA